MNESFTGRTAAPDDSPQGARGIPAGRRRPRAALLAGTLTLLLVSQAVPRSLATSGAPSDIEQDFLAPPASARSHVYWHWMGPNFSKDGITKDLEAMQAAGIGGAIIFNLTSAVQESHAPTLNTPWPDHTYRSPAYWDAVRHAAAEGARLGVDIGLHNSVGYSTTGGPWVDEPRSMQRLVWSQVELEGERSAAVTLPVPEIPQYQGWGKTGRPLSYFRDVAVLAVPVDPAELQPGDVLDLTPAMTPAGDLRWTARPGRWIVYRLGHASTGAAPHPVPDDVLGKTFEADKLSLEQSRFHWAAVLDPVRLHLGPWIGKSFTHVLIDSYEAGSQNWTPGFREEFVRRKGYDPLPWLLTLGPTASGNPKAAPARVLGSADQTARFDWDYRDVVAALYQERSWEAASDLVRAAGLELAFEPYSGPFDTVAATRVADRPMLEFWTHNVEVSASPVTAAARAAGRRVVAAEAFTSAPMYSAWNETPGFLKASADAALASGVNRMVLHHWVHQPFDDRYKPGMGMGWWGTHFSRHQTWAEPGKAFFAYLTRAQALLQRGETPIDIVSVGFNGAPDADAIPMRAFLDDVRVVDGRVTLASGRSYAIVHVPHAGALEPSAVKRIQHLLAQGAVVVSPRPDRSPSLAGYPACDEEVRRVAEQLWSAASTHPERRVGPGRLFTELDEARRMLPLEPAARIEDGAADHVRIHARQDGANRIFFVTNLAQAAAHVSVSFRVADMQPELWDAETGTIAPAAVWRASGSRTTVDLAIEGATSVFVVFRRPLVAGRTHVTNVQADCRVTTTTGARGETMVMAEQPCSGTATLSSGARVPFSVGRSSVTGVRGPWAVTLAPSVGSATRRTMDALGSLSAQQDGAAKYFSGTATYTTSMRVDAASLAQGRRVFLDLGGVADLARITVNGRDLGVLWHAPFVRDVTSALRPGDNGLVVAVTNTWHNRLVGDEQFPPDCEWGPSRSWASSWPAPQFKGQDVGRPLKAYPDWFLANAPRPTAGRLTFSTWSYHLADTPLLPSGLLGPVRLIVMTPAVVQP